MLPNGIACGVYSHGSGELSHLKGRHLHGRLQTMSCVSAITSGEIIMPIAPIIGDQNTARNDRVMELLCHKYDSGIRKNVPFACGYHQEHGEEVLCFAVGAAGTAEASTAGRCWSFR